MPQIIFGQTELIDIEHVAEMLRALAPSNIDTSSVDWRTNAERAIAHAKTEAGKRGGSLASAEQMSMLIMNWAIDERLALTRASQSSSR
jgi:NifU-like protein involved in Fe-S cluster formation